MPLLLLTGSSISRQVFHQETREQAGGNSQKWTLRGSLGGFQGSQSPQSPGPSASPGTRRIPELDEDAEKMLIVIRVSQCPLLATVRIAGAGKIPSQAGSVRPLVAYPGKTPS